MAVGDALAGTLGRWEDADVTEGELGDQALPWSRKAKVTRWDYGIGFALIPVTSFALSPWLGASWRDTWIEAGCWLLVLVPLIEVRRRLSRDDWES